MATKFNATTIENNEGIRTIAGGGTNASTAPQALINLGAYPSSNPSGFITGFDSGQYVTSSQTGLFYPASNPSGFITSLENVVDTTGDQNILGEKTFLDTLRVGTGVTSLFVSEDGNVGIGTENPQFNLDVSGSSRFTERPQVNGTGVLLQGEVQNNTIISGVIYSAQVNVKNDHTGTLYKGQPVYIKGATGGNILVGLASNTGEASSSKTLGLIYQDSLAANAFGTVITDGLLSNFDVGSAAAGDPIWLGQSGDLIYGLTNKPVAPNHLVYLGVVTRTSNNGEVFVKVQNGYELDELHDVAVKNSPTGQFLFKNANSQWVGKNLDSSDASALGLSRSLSNVQDGTIVTATLGITASKSLLVPANTFLANDCPEIIVRVRRIGTTHANSFQTRIYWNPTPDIIGNPILIGRGPNVATGSNTLYIARLLSIINATNNTSVSDVSVQNTTDFGITVPLPQNIAIDWTQNGYIVVAITNLSTSDQTCCDIIRIR